MTRDPTMPAASFQNRVESILSRWEQADSHWDSNEIDRQCLGDPALASEVANQIRSIESCPDCFPLDESHIAISELKTAPVQTTDSYATEWISPPSGEQLNGRLPLASRFHLASGGIGSVWVYADESLGREVAVKFLNPDAATSRQQYEAFYREAEITAKLDHPGVPPVLAVGESDSGQPYFVMRLIAGHCLDVPIANLHRNLKHRPAHETRQQLRNLIKQLATVCRIVDYARTRRVVHGDIKPANIRVGRHGEVMLLDWGMALVVDRHVAGPKGELPTIQLSQPQREQRLSGGTIGYISPEAWQGQAASPASDTYALGVILYEILTGALPFDPTALSSSPEQARESIARRVTRGDHDDVEPKGRQRLGKLSGLSDLAAITRIAMQVHPEDRYATPMQMADDLERVLDDQPVSVRRPSRTTQCLRFARKHKTLAFGLPTALSLIAVLSLALLWTQQRAASDAKNQQVELQQLSDLAMRSLAGFTADQVVAEIAMRYESLRRIAEDPDLIPLLNQASSEPDSTRPMLAQWLEQQSEATGILLHANSVFLLDAQGVQQARQPPSESIGKNFQHRNYFHGQTIEAEPGTHVGMLHRAHISTVYVSSSSQQARIALVHPVKDDSGSVVGLLAMSINLENFGTLKRPSENDSMHISLVDARRYPIDGQSRSGVILAHTSSKRDPRPVDGSQIEYAAAGTTELRLEPNRPTLASLPDLFDPSAASETAVSRIAWRPMDHRSGLSNIDLPDWWVVVQR